MNETITIDGKDYEVLPLDRIGEITHARLAGGKVVDARNTGFIEIETAHSDMALAPEELEPFGIQPLKMFERVPVEFEARFYFRDGFWEPTYLIDVVELSGIPESEVMKFKCVQIMEEA